VYGRAAAELLWLSSDAGSPTHGGVGVRSGARDDDRCDLLEVFHSLECAPRLPTGDQRLLKRT
jgi:hypothetical protein